MEDLNYGSIRIKLDEMIKKQGISKNKLATQSRNAKDTAESVL